MSAFIETGFPGLLLFEPTVFEDSRGCFFESYNAGLFGARGLPQHWVQDNQSSSCAGVIRGLHYQLPPHAQTKLIRVLRGKILDVVVDLRKGSPTFGQHFAKVLSAKNRRQLYIPKGFAHGFSVLSDKAEVLYKCDASYDRTSEAGIRFNDPALGIDWRVPEDRAIISEKDRALPLLSEAVNPFIFEG